jgi:hypothetical protein
MDTGTTPTPCSSFCGRPSSRLVQRRVDALAALLQLILELPFIEACPGTPNPSSHSLQLFLQPPFIESPQPCPSPSAAKSLQLSRELPFIEAVRLVALQLRL